MVARQQNFAGSQTKQRQMLAPLISLAYGRAYAHKAAPSQPLNQCIRHTTSAALHSCEPRSTRQAMHTDQTPQDSTPVVKSFAISCHGQRRKKTLICVQCTPYVVCTDRNLCRYSTSMQALRWVQAVNTTMFCPYHPCCTAL
jgi:hypothetical protein